MYYRYNCGINDLDSENWLCSRMLAPPRTFVNRFQLNRLMIFIFVMRYFPVTDWNKHSWKGYLRQSPHRQFNLCLNRTDILCKLVKPFE